MEIYLDLPDVVIIHLFRFLSEKDCIAFSFSGVCDQFTFLYAEKRKISMSKCYFVSPSCFKAYITNWIGTEQITSMNISHCYWLSIDLLLSTVLSMTQLNVLYMQDTQLNLFHLIEIFQSCLNISKLGISLVEEKWDHSVLSFNKPSVLNDIFSSGMEKLTHLKILVFNSNYYIDSWLVILPLLSYCKKCVDLHLEISYTEEYFRHGPFGMDDYDDEIVCEARNEYFPRLKWMSLLEKLVILKRGTGNSISYQDECLKALIEWMFSKCGLPLHLKRLCIQEAGISDVVFNQEYSTLSLKSILLGTEFNQDTKRLVHVEHLGCIGISKLPTLPNLRYIRGYCINSEGVDEFCREHPNLEHLLFHDNELDFFLQNDWKLTKLKTLVYSCGYPIREILLRFVDACPNLEALHIGYTNKSALDPVTAVDGIDFLKFIQLDHLTTLSLNSVELLEGEFFEMLLAGCPQLKSLQLCGGLNNTKCFDNFCRFLPLAKNLRDLRLHYTDFDGDSLPDALILDALTKCKKLERLVLYEEELMKKPWDHENFQHYLCDFVITMKNLVAFCFVSYTRFNATSLSGLNQKFSEMILPSRPAFWFHFGRHLPLANDPNVPRIHYDEIVCPINHFQMFLPF